MVAAKENDYAVKLKDREARQRAYTAYCDWLAKGKTKKSFSYEETLEDGTYVGCIWATIENYMKASPEDFDPLKKELAYSKGCAKWEGVVDDTAEGIRKDTSVPTLNMIMRNKYKWDTVEHTQDKESNQSSLDHFADSAKQARAEYTAKRSEDRSSEQDDIAHPPVD